MIKIAQRDCESAAAVQRELLECQIQRLGRDHPETLATRAILATILLEQALADFAKEVC